MTYTKTGNRGISRDRLHGIVYATAACFSLLFCTFAANPPATFNDGIDRTDPNFVTASLLVMSPGDELYSCEEYIAGRKEWT